MFCTGYLEYLIPFVVGRGWVGLFSLSSDHILFSFCLVSVRPEPFRMQFSGVQRDEKGQHFGAYSATRPPAASPATSWLTSRRTCTCEKVANRFQIFISHPAIENFLIISNFPIDHFPREHFPISNLTISNFPISNFPISNF